MSGQILDFVVIGAGCFGAWTADELLRTGHSVLLLDAYGPAHSRASSGGESRILRMGYGNDALYTRSAIRSLDGWKTLSERIGGKLFHATGVLWLVGNGDVYTQHSQETLQSLGVHCERLSIPQLQTQFPQISVEDIEWALWEPGSGILMARKSVQALVYDSIQQGLQYRLAEVLPPAPRTRRRLKSVALSTGEIIAGGTFIFACGAWLSRLFPELLAERIFPTRQEVFFFAPPPGDPCFNCHSLPAWFHHPALVYGMPDIENRGVKISIDKHGPRIDPETGLRVPTSDGISEARQYLGKRFPKLREAPLCESRVCQYENTANGDFLIDRHPELEDVVLVGGGSGHGFKHAPAVGEYVKRMVTGNVEGEPRFSLAAKSVIQARAVF